MEAGDQLQGSTGPLLTRMAQPHSDSGRSQHRQTSEAINAFWAELRKRLSHWNQQLDDLAQRYEVGTTTPTVADCQKLEDLKQQLRIVRKHCLGSTLYLEDWEVPELPNADLRLMHVEFTKCSSKWEDIKDVLVPKEKFVFRRYREELARRRALGIPLDAPSSITNTQLAQDDSPLPTQEDQKSCLQNLSDTTIRIGKDGTVTTADDDNIDQTITTSTLLLRNLSNCTVTIEKQLQALHVVHATNTSVVVLEPISSAIHVTDCRHSTVKAKAQQLRIHESENVTFHVDLVAGAILEDSTSLLFVSESIDVKDFNWLRAGIPSPNFSLELPSDGSTQSQSEMVSSTSTKESPDLVVVSGPVNQMLPPLRQDASTNHPGQVVQPGEETSQCREDGVAPSDNSADDDDDEDEL